MNHYTDSHLANDQSRHPKRTLIWVLAGEVSGDIAGARLMEALHKLDPSIIFVGVGGSCMEARGLTPLFPMQDLAMMGFWEVIPHRKRIKECLLIAEEDIRFRQPDMILTIDFPSFAARLVKKVSRHFKTRCVHYVAPQVWAWGRWRAKSYEKIWDKILCFFPFEPQWFKRTRYKSEWVGHPEANATSVISGDAVWFRKHYMISDNSPIILFMMGSRLGELSHIVPHLRGLVESLASHPLKPIVVMPIAGHLVGDLHDLTKGWNSRPIIISEKREIEGAFSAATCALTKSGTVTLQLALSGIPMVIAHRVNFISGLIARRLMKVPFVGIVNLLLGKEMCPEFLQGRCNPKHLAPAIAELLESETARKRQKEGFKKLPPFLRPSLKDDPSVVAAQAVVEVLRASIPD